MKDYFDSKFKQNLLLIVIGVTVAAVILNIGKALGIIGYLIGLITPLIFGGAIAFILSVPMNFFDRQIRKRVPERSRLYKISNILALLIALIVVFAIISFLISTIIPNVAESTRNLIAIVSESYPTWLAWLESKGISIAMISSLQSVIDPTQLQDILSSGGSNLFSFAASKLGNVFGTVGNIGIGFVFAIYILLTKETLGRQAKKIAFSYLPEAWARELCATLELARSTFSKFLSGQCLEAVILGSMFCIVLEIARIPYALSIGTIIGATSLVPVVGAFIGMLFGLLLIAVVSIKKTIVFIVIFIIIQQIEGNLIYPRVIGNQIGLPALWTLLATIIGAKVGGIVGIIVFIPLFSVIYELIRRDVSKRLSEKDITV